MGNSYCIPPPTCSNAGAISDIVTLSIGFNTSYLWYAFGFSIYGSALCSYGTPAGDVYFPHWLPYLSIIVPAGIVWFSLIVPGTRPPFGAHFSQSIFSSASKNLVSLTTNSSVPIKYVPDKDRKAFASDLKTIYHASDEEKARLALDRVTEKWTAKYPNSMKRW